MMMVSVGLVAPGTEFSFRGTLYVRATEAQEPRHPAQDILRMRGEGSAVLAYMVGKKHGKETRTPMSIVTTDDRGVPTQVWVKKERK
jgi:hypothetical protein